MKAILVQGPSDQPKPVWTDCPDPVPGPGEVIVKVAATAVNRADLLQIRGLYPAPAGESQIPGLEAAGVIESWHESVSGVTAGTRVCALLAGGGYAERVAVPQEMLLSIPAAMSFEVAAAIPEVWYTAYVNLFLEGALKSGETVLIHAGASGVGTAAIQLAKAAGCVVVATCGTSAKADLCRSLGADCAVNYRDGRPAAQIKEYLTGRAVNLVLDPVGGSYLQDNLELLGSGGRLVLIAVMGGAKAELDLAAVLRKRLRIIGSTLRPRSRAEKSEITKRFLVDVWPKLTGAEAGSAVFRPVIDRSYPIEEAAAALEALANNRNAGKIVLKVSTL